MSVKYEVTAITGKYTDREGNEKNRYAKLGVVIDSRNGPMLKLESVPIGWDGWAYLNEPKPREDRQSRRQESKPEQTGGFEDDSDIPF